jgi:molecular chaperone HscB
MADGQRGGAAGSTKSLLCWNCAVPLERDHAVCGGCGTVQLGAARESYFTLLGVPERFDVDAAVLEQAFHRMSRLLHPDRFATATPLERRMAVQRGTRLNDAYRALRDPVKRGTYLLQREGVQRGEDSATQDPELLMEILEGRERVAELKESLRDGAPGARDELVRMRAGFDAKLASLHAALQSLFARYDAGERAGVLEAVASTLDHIRYYAGIRGELDQLALAHRLPA